MTDVAHRRGMTVNLDRLGAPVVLIDPRRRRGGTRLADVVAETPLRR